MDVVFGLYDGPRLCLPPVTPSLEGPAGADDLGPALHVLVQRRATKVPPTSWGTKA